MNKELTYLTSLFGASGSESDIRQAIINEIKSYCDKISVDRLGNIIAEKHGLVSARRRFVFAAAMDETALMITRIEKEGFLRFDLIGDIDPRSLPGKRVVIGRHKYPGVIGTLPPHLSEESAANGANDLFVDFGAKSAEEAAEYVSEGDLIGFESEYHEFGDRMVRAKALDNRAGCFILTELIKNDLPTDAVFVFSVLNEVGGYGLETAISQIHPDYLILLNGVKENTDEKTAILGKGAVLSCTENTFIPDPSFSAALKDAALGESVPFQIGNTVSEDQGKACFRRLKSDCKTALLSLPCRNLRSPVCTASLNDLDNLRRLLMAILKKWGLEAVK